MNLINFSLKKDMPLSDISLVATDSVQRLSCILKTAITKILYFSAGFSCEGSLYYALAFKIHMTTGTIMSNCKNIGIAVSENST